MSHATNVAVEQKKGETVPSFDDFALAKEERTVLLSRTRSTSSCVFLDRGRQQAELFRCLVGWCTLDMQTYFSFLYSSPKLINACSYSRVAASELAEGALEIISL